MMPPERKRPKRNGKYVGASLFATPGLTKPQIPKEEAFLRAVESGDYPSVRRMLHDDPGLNVNCTDLMGRTPLRIAVQNESEEIVELLLDKAGRKNMYESLLLAISLDQNHIAMIILRHPMYLKLEKEARLYSNDSLLFSVSNHDSLFSAETTPLILAAQRNNYEVISLLLSRGARIEEPHITSCDCSKCETLRNYDELRQVRLRLDTYAGLSSEAYISLSANDPILFAFNIRQRLSTVAMGENHYRDEYALLRSKLSSYVVKLLENVRGDHELDIILNEGSAWGEEILSRLQLAIHYHEKKFVAHCACQKKLTTIWFGSIHNVYARCPSKLHLLVIPAIALSVPFLAPIYLIAPATKISRFLRTPFVKFIGQTTSFLLFLSLIITFSFKARASHDMTKPSNVLDMSRVCAMVNNMTAAGIVASSHIREFEPNVLLLWLHVFITGMLWQEVKQLYGSSWKGYFRSRFNFLDTISLMLYMASFSLRYVSYLKTFMALKYFADDIDVCMGNLLKGDHVALYHYYWLFADRYYWNAYDPLVIAEGLFAVANVLSFSRLFYLLAASQRLGPLQISISRMMADIFKFAMIFFIVFAAFLVGLNNLYWYYDPEVRGAVEMTNLHPVADTKAGHAFGTMERTFRTVYWALFGMGDSDVVELGDHYHGAFTMRIGYIVFGAYNVAAVIVLLNMLIAMMSRSFDQIQSQEDIEWKYARAQLYMDFIQEGSTLPVPLNMIPSPKAIFRFCTAPCRWLAQSKKPDDEDKSNIVKLNNTKSDETVPACIGKSDQLDFQSPSRRGSAISKVSHQKNRFKDDNISDSAVRRLQQIGNKLYNKSDLTSLKHDNLSYEVVMKRIVKRFIFKSQDNDTSPLEGEIEELKQDLSSTRYELANALDNQQKKILQAVNYISAKLDVYTGINTSVEPALESLRTNYPQPSESQQCTYPEREPLQPDGCVPPQGPSEYTTPTPLTSAHRTGGTLDDSYGYESIEEDEIIPCYVMHNQPSPGGPITNTSDPSQIDVHVDMTSIYDTDANWAAKEIDVDSMSVNSMTNSASDDGSYTTQPANIGSRQPPKYSQDDIQRLLAAFNRHYEEERHLGATPLIVITRPQDGTAEFESIAMTEVDKTVSDSLARVPSRRLFGFARNRKGTSTKHRSPPLNLPGQSAETSQREESTFRFNPESIVQALKSVFKRGGSVNTSKSNTDTRQISESQLNLTSEDHTISQC